MAEVFQVRGEHVHFLKGWMNGAQYAIYRGAAIMFSDDYAKAESKLYEKMFADPENKIQIVIGQLDSICSVCKFMFQ